DQSQPGIGVLGARIPQPHARVVEDLAHERAGHPLEVLVRLGREAGESAVELLAADALRLALQLGDDRLGVEAPLPGEEAGELALEDLLDLRHLFAPALQVALDQVLERIDALQKEVADPPGGRIDVARDAEVDDEERPAAAAAHRLLEVAADEERLVRARRRDDEIRRLEGAQALRERQGLDVRELLPE